MSVFSQTNVGILVDSVNLSGFASELTLGPIAVDVLDFTNYAAGGWKIKKPGLIQFDATVKGFQDYAATGVNSFINVNNVGTVQTITVSPTGGANVGDPSFLGQGNLTGYTPIGGKVGEPADFDLAWKGTSVISRGLMLHPVAARTATGNGTATAFTPPTASQSLYASFHVLSVSGAGSIQFTVQTDTLVGMGTATTRITSQSFTAVGAQLASVAGAITGGFIRCQWTITGFTSVTFAVAAGVQ